MLDFDRLLGAYAPVYLEDKFCNFNHVTRNLIALVLIGDSDKVKEDSLDNVKRYLTLLDEFPEFKERELTQYTSDVLGSIEDYINGYERGLRKVK